MTKYWVDREIAKALLTRAWLETFGNRKAMSRLAASGNPTDEAIAEAVARTHGGPEDREERRALERVRRIRRRMRRSRRTLHYRDYGAGSHLEERAPDAAAPSLPRQRRLGRLARTASGPLRQLHFFFQLVRRLQPARVLELGSFVGLSAAAMAEAMTLNDTADPQLITLEGAEPIAELARDTLEQLELPHADVLTGPFDETLEEALAELGQVELALVDGHHKKEPTLDYFHRILPHMCEGGVMLFDDILWNAGMREAWAEIQGHSAVTRCVDLLRMGLVVVGEDDTRRRETVTLFAA